MSRQTITIHTEDAGDVEFRRRVFMTTTCDFCDVPQENATMWMYGGGNVPILICSTCALDHEVR